MSDTDSFRVRSPFGMDICMSRIARLITLRNLLLYREKSLCSAAGCYELNQSITTNILFNTSYSKGLPSNFEWRQWTRGSSATAAGTPGRCPGRRSAPGTAPPCSCRFRSVSHIHLFIILLSRQTVLVKTHF